MSSFFRVPLLCLLGLGANAQDAQGFWQDARVDEQPENDLMLLQSHFSMRIPAGSQPPRVSNLPRLVVDLDVAPEQRWKNVTQYYIQQGVYPRALFERTPLGPEVLDLITKMPMEEEHLREIKGIINDLKEYGVNDSHMNFFMTGELGDDLFGLTDGPGGVSELNMVKVHSTYNYCSGLLVAMPNGTVVHGRNMDYDGFKVRVGNRTLYLHDVTVEVVFVRGGAPLIVSTHWPMQTGVHTAMRVAEPTWSYEQNTRMHMLSTSILSGLFDKTRTMKLAVRKIMENTGDFESAVQQIYALRLMSPRYVIMAGSLPYQGAVITMDRNGHDPASPLITRLSNASRLIQPPLETRATWTNSWHIIQTNDDLNKVPHDLRRPTTELWLRESSQDMVSPEWVFNRMGMAPLKNDGTIFTNVFVPATGYHKTVVYLENRPNRD